MPDYTPTQIRILRVLSDGYPHHKDEITLCIGDEFACPTNTKMHLSLLRKKLRPIGQDILVEFIRGRVHYRHIRLLHSPYAS